MESLRKTIGYGILVWLFPFIISILLFPLKNNSNTLLYESIMTISLVLAISIIGNYYLNIVPRSQMKEGFKLGIIWILISIFLDLIIFMPASSPMKMNLIIYLKDIGLTYLIIPIITTSSGYLADTNY